MKYKRLGEAEKLKIIKLYGEEEESVAMVARQLGRNPKTIHYWLKAVGINRSTSVAQRLAHTAGRRESMIGENNPMWKGGRQVAGTYIGVRVYPENIFSCMANHCGYVLEHRLVMAQHLGRPLTKHEIVHHLNGVRMDNRPCNLALVSVNTHSTYTFNRLMQKRIRDLEAQLSQQKLL